MKTLSVVLVLMGIGGLWMASSASAVGEVFKVEATGTQYCGPYSYVKFNASNNLDFWIRMVSDSEILVSLTPGFDTETFTIYLTTYPMDSKKVSYIGGTYVDNYTYIGLQGISKIDKYGEIANTKGTFMWSNWFYDDCFASGKFKTVQRLQ